MFSITSGQMPHHFMSIWEGQNKGFWLKNGGKSYKILTKLKRDRLHIVWKFTFQIWKLGNCLFWNCLVILLFCAFQAGSLFITLPIKSMINLVETMNYGFKKIGDPLEIKSQLNLLDHKIHHYTMVVLHYFDCSRIKDELQLLDFLLHC